jgi:cell division septal protein FtsQ
MRRGLIAICVLVVIGAAVYIFALRGSATAPAQAQPTRPVAQIGEGKRVILVGEEGELLGASKTKGAPKFPVLVMKKRPPSGSVRGHVLEEVRILAATPKALRPYLAKANVGKTGIDVELTSGIEIRFGDQSEAPRKWKAAAAVLADPSVTLLSYVDVHSPTRPSVEGEGVELPPSNRVSAARFP